MIKNALLSALALGTIALSSPLMAQGIGHSVFMRGSIVGADARGTVVCIGKADGAEVGQSLEVYRVVQQPGPSKGPGPNYRRQLVGHVQIDHIYDDHFAHVRVIDGRPARNDIVELRRN